MPADYVYKKKDGNTIDCYGKIYEDSNFAVVCENELYDGIAADIDGDKYNTWKKFAITWSLTIAKMLLK